MTTKPLPLQALWPLQSFWAVMQAPWPLQPFTPKHFPSVPSANAEGTEGKCFGVNGCKGQGACKTAQNDCKGHNACKGKGFVVMTDTECAEQSGEFDGSDAIRRRGAGRGKRPVSQHPNPERP